MDLELEPTTQQQSCQRLNADMVVIQANLDPKVQSDRPHPAAAAVSSFSDCIDPEVQSDLQAQLVWCALFGRNLRSRMPLATTLQASRLVNNGIPL
jgi:hypothetical protein